MISWEVFMDIFALKRQGLGLRAIARKLGIHRNTVRKHLEGRRLPTYRRTKRRDSILAPYQQVITDWLEEDSYQATWIVDRLRQRSYTGSYDTVKRHGRKVKEQRTRLAYLRFETQPGHQAQADGGDFQIQGPDGKTTTIYLFALLLGFSRVVYAEFVERCTLETFLDCHIRGFRRLRGVPGEILPDYVPRNMMAYDQFGYSTKEGKGPHVGADPVGKRPRRGGGGLGGGIAAGAKKSDKDLGVADLPRGGIDHRNGLPGIVNKELLSGPVLLAHDEVEFSSPPAVLLTEPAVLVAPPSAGLACLYSSHERKSATPFRLSSLWISVQSGRTREPAGTTGPAGKSLRSNSASSSSAGRGQPSPASVARRRYSPTVERAMDTLLAIVRLVRPCSHLSRSTSLIFRMDTLSAATCASFPTRIVGRHRAPAVIPRRYPSPKGGRLALESVAGFHRKGWPE